MITSPRCLRSSIFERKKPERDWYSINDYCKWKKMKRKEVWPLISDWMGLRLHQSFVKILGLNHWPYVFWKTIATAQSVDIWGSTSVFWIDTHWDLKFWKLFLFFLSTRKTANSVLRANAGGKTLIASCGLLSILNFFI